MPSQQNHNHAVMFADIVGSTHMYESLGDTLAKKLITEMETAISQVIKDCGGFVVEIIGDEVMSRFNDPSTAVQAACRIQERAELYAEQSGMPMATRIGLHYGPAILEEGRMYGDTINIAARVADIAKARQIITTEQVILALPPEQRQMARRFDKVQVKGKLETLIIYDLLWRREDVTFMHTAPATQNMKQKTLVLDYAGRVYRLTPIPGITHIGRDTSNELVVGGTSASRTHATLEYNRGKFMFKDISTNGTYIAPRNQQSLYIRRESIPLLGQGRIGLGEPVSEQNRHIISYHLQEND
jgi:adenylate cyclase